MIKIYDEKIRQIKNMIGKESVDSFEYSENNIWKTTDSNELILRNESALELGPSHLGGTSLFAMTSNKDLIYRDEISVIGGRLGDIENREVSYGKVVLFKLKDGIDDDNLYSKFKELERVRYRLHLEGFMLRASTVQRRETVRISKEAMGKNISFEKVGNAMIKEFKKNELVDSVHIIFVVENDSLIEELSTITEEVDEITDAMNNIFDGIEVDCHSCTFENLCEEIDGMREMHKKALL